MSTTLRGFASDAFLEFMLEELPLFGKILVELNLDAE